MIGGQNQATGPQSLDLRFTSLSQDARAFGKETIQTEVGNCGLVRGDRDDLVGNARYDFGIQNHGHDVIAIVDAINRDLVGGTGRRRQA